MAHSCVDWTANPPIRKIPILVLRFGADRVYTSVPKDFRTLEEVTRREFGLADVELKISSSCVNLCDGLPARITESVWEHIRSYIGCASVEVGPISAGNRPNHGAAEENRHVRLDEVENRRSFKAPNLFLEAQDEEGTQVDQQLSNKQGSSTKEPIRQDPPLDHERDEVNAEQEQEPRHEESDQPWEEEVSAVPPPRSRRRRLVVTEDEDADDDSEQEEAPAKPSRPPAGSPPKEIKKEKDESTQRRYQIDPPLHESKPKRESDARSNNDERSPQGSRPVSQLPQESQASRAVESNDAQKLMIRVAHRASKQESKFTTKPSTKVAKVLAGACKSFGLDAARATLYLIVSVDGEGDPEENLFPCDKNDTIARAGAEHDTETKFLLKIAGEP